VQHGGVVSHTQPCESLSQSSIMSGHNYLRNARSGVWLEIDLLFSIHLLTITYEPEEL